MTRKKIKINKTSAKISTEEELKDRILNQYKTFEDFKTNYPDFDKLSEEAIHKVYRFFHPITIITIIKFILICGGGVLIFNFWKEILLIPVLIFSWIESWPTTVWLLIFILAIIWAFSKKLDQIERKIDNLTLSIENFTFNVEKAKKTRT